METLNKQIETSVDLGSLRQNINQILLGQEIRIFNDGIQDNPMEYYFRYDDFIIETKDGFRTRRSALYCDAFFRSRFISEYEIYDKDSLIRILDVILESLDVVFYDSVLKFWESDQELFSFLGDNYSWFPITVPELMIPRKGIYLHKQRSWKSILANDAYAPFNKVRTGANLKRERESKNLTQAQLSHICGVDPKTIGNIERARTTFFFRTLENLARGLQIDISRLLL